MVASGLCFVAVTAIVKHIGSAVPAAQGAFLRYLLGLVFLVPMLGPIRAAQLTRRQLGLFAARGVLHTLAVILWFFAMARIPLAEVTAMGYLTPIFTSIIAVLILREAMPRRRVIAVGVAVLGALVILRPGVKVIEPGHLAMLVTGMAFAGGYTITKIMSAQVSATVIVGMLNITVTLGLLPFALAVWVPVEPMTYLWLFGVACFATMGHYCMTFAYAAAPMTVTQPVTFLQLVWAVTLGWFVFGESVDAFVLAGGLMIMTSVMVLTLREARARRQLAAGAAAPPH